MANENAPHAAAKRVHCIAFGDGDAPDEWQASLMPFRASTSAMEEQENLFRAQFGLVSVADARNGRGAVPVEEPRSMRAEAARVDAIARARGIDDGQPIVGQLDDLGLFFGVVRGRSVSRKRGRRPDAAKPPNPPSASDRSAFDISESTALRDDVCTCAVEECDKERERATDSTSLGDAVPVSGDAGDVLATSNDVGAVETKSEVMQDVPGSLHMQTRSRTAAARVEAASAARDYDDEDENNSDSDDGEIEVVFRRRGVPLNTQMCELFRQLRMEVTSKPLSRRTIRITAKPPAQLGLMYTASTSTSEMREIAVFLELSKSERGEHCASACVRFSISSSEVDAQCSLEYNSIDISCTCSPTYSTTCPHRAIFANDSLLRNEVCFALRMKISVDATAQNSRGWSAFVVGHRKISSNATWIVLRECKKANSLNDYIPVIEGRTNDKMSKPLQRRLSCTKHKRNSSNRGLCIHERVTLNAAEELDKKGAEEETPDSASASAKVSYLSVLPRRGFPCKEDLRATERMVESLRKSQNARFEAGQVSKSGVGLIPEGTYPEDYFVTDARRFCSHCGYLLIGWGEASNCSKSSRIAVLHTLVFGSTYIRVHDLICPACGRTTVYDGFYDGLFALSRKTILSRELLDFWMYSIAMLGQTFREAFEMSKYLAMSASARSARWGGFHLSCKRGVGNKVFSKFLACLEYRDDDTLNALFSCKTCEKVDDNGRRVLRAVVLDGTATGVLGKLPLFERPKTLINRANIQGRHQYIIPNSYVRGFIYSLFKKMMHAQSQKKFDVELPAITVCPGVRELLFNQNRDPRIHGHETELSAFIPKILSAPTLELALRRKEKGETVRPVQFFHKLRNESLRGGLAEFASCLVYESISVVILPSNEHENSAKRACSALDSFLSCDHYDESSNIGFEHCCRSCTSKLQKNIGKESYYLPCLDSLILVLTEAQEEDPSTPVRAIAHFASNLLQRCISLSSSFTTTFKKAQTRGAREYDANFSSLAAPSHVESSAHPASSTPISSPPPSSAPPNPSPDAPTASSAPPSMPPATAASQIESTDEVGSSTPMSSPPPISAPANPSPAEPAASSAPPALPPATTAAPAAVSTLPQLTPHDSSMTHIPSSSTPQSSQAAVSDKPPTPLVLPTLNTVSKSEAASSGDVFPGRPLLRPRVVFKNSKQEGWREECAKDYRYNPSHSPGLFTIQCACDHPMLLGVKVMNESESIRRQLTLSSQGSRRSPKSFITITRAI